MATEEPKPVEVKKPKSAAVSDRAAFGVPVAGTDTDLLETAKTPEADRTFSSPEMQAASTSLLDNVEKTSERARSGQWTEVTPAEMKQAGGQEGNLADMNKAFQAHFPNASQADVDAMTQAYSGGNVSMRQVVRNIEPHLDQDMHEWEGGYNFGHTIERTVLAIERLENTDARLSFSQLPDARARRLMEIYARRAARGQTGEELRQRTAREFHREEAEESVQIWNSHRELSRDYHWGEASDVAAGTLEGKAAQFQERAMRPPTLVSRPPTASGRSRLKGQQDVEHGLITINRTEGFVESVRKQENNPDLTAREIYDVMQAWRKENPEQGTGLKHPWVENYFADKTPALTLEALEENPQFMRLEEEDPERAEIWRNVVRDFSTLEEQKKEIEERQWSLYHLRKKQRRGTNNIPVMAHHSAPVASMALQKFDRVKDVQESLTSETRRKFKQDYDADLDAQQAAESRRTGWDTAKDFGKFVLGGEMLDTVDFFFDNTAPNRKPDGTLYTPRERIEWQQNSKAAFEALPPAGKDRYLKDPQFAAEQNQRMASMREEETNLTQPAMEAVGQDFTQKERDEMNWGPGQDATAMAHRLAHARAKNRLGAMGIAYEHPHTSVYPDWGLVRIRISEEGGIQKAENIVKNRQLAKKIFDEELFIAQEEVDLKLSVVAQMGGTWVNTDVWGSQKMVADGHTVSQRILGKKWGAAFAGIFANPTAVTVRVGDEIREKDEPSLLRSRRYAAMSEFKTPGPAEHLLHALTFTGAAAGMFEHITGRILEAETPTETEEFILSLTYKDREMLESLTPDMMPTFHQAWQAALWPFGKTGSEDLIGLTEAQKAAIFNVSGKDRINIMQKWATSLGEKLAIMADDSPEAVMDVYRRTQKHPFLAEQAYRHTTEFGYLLDMSPAWTKAWGVAAVISALGFEFTAFDGVSLGFYGVAKAVGAARKAQKFIWSDTKAITKIANKFEEADIDYTRVLAEGTEEEILTAAKALQEAAEEATVKLKKVDPQLAFIISMKYASRLEAPSNYMDNVLSLATGSRKATENFRRVATALGVADDQIEAIILGGAHLSTELSRNTYVRSIADKIESTSNVSRADAVKAAKKQVMEELAKVNKLARENPRPYEIYSRPNVSKPGSTDYFVKDSTGRWYKWFERSDQGEFTLVDDASERVIAGQRIVKNETTGQPATFEIELRGVGPEVEPPLGSVIHRWDSSDFDDVRKGLTEFFADKKLAKWNMLDEQGEVIVGASFESGVQRLPAYTTDEAGEVIQAGYRTGGDIDLGNQLEAAHQWWLGEPLGGLPGDLPSVLTGVLKGDRAAVLNAQREMLQAQLKEQLAQRQLADELVRVWESSRGPQYRAWKQASEELPKLNREIAKLDKQIAEASDKVAKNTFEGTAEAIELEKHKQHLAQLADSLKDLLPATKEKSIRELIKVLGGRVDQLMRVAAIKIGRKKAAAQELSALTAANTQLVTKRSEMLRIVTAVEDIADWRTTLAQSDPLILALFAKADTAVEAGDTALAAQIFTQIDQKLSALSTKVNQASVIRTPRVLEIDELAHVLRPRKQADGTTIYDYDLTGSVSSNLDDYGYQVGDTLKLHDGETVKILRKTWSNPDSTIPDRTVLQETWELSNGARVQGATTTVTHDNLLQKGMVIRRTLPDGTVVLEEVIDSVRVGEEALQVTLRSDVPIPTPKAPEAAPPAPAPKPAAPPAPAPAPAPTVNPDILLGKSGKPYSAALAKSLAKKAKAKIAAIEAKAQKIDDMASPSPAQLDQADALRETIVPVQKRIDALERHVKALEDAAQPAPAPKPAPEPTTPAPAPTPTPPASAMERTVAIELSPGSITGYKGTVVSVDDVLKGSEVIVNAPIARRLAVEEGWVLQGSNAAYRTLKKAASNAAKRVVALEKQVASAVKEAAKYGEEWDITAASRLAAAKSELAIQQRRSAEIPKVLREIAFSLHQGRKFRKQAPVLSEKFVNILEDAVIEAPASGKFLASLWRKVRTLNGTRDGVPNYIVDATKLRQILVASWGEKAVAALLEDITTAVGSTYGGGAADILSRLLRETFDDAGVAAYNAAREAALVKAAKQQTKRGKIRLAMSQSTVPADIERGRKALSKMVDVEVPPALGPNQLAGYVEVSKKDFEILQAIGDDLNKVWRKTHTFSEEMAMADLLDDAKKALWSLIGQANKGIAGLPNNLKKLVAMYNPLAFELGSLNDDIAEVIKGGMNLMDEFGSEMAAITKVAVRSSKVEKIRQENYKAALYEFLGTRNPLDIGARVTLPGRAQLEKATWTNTTGQKAIFQEALDNWRSNPRNRPGGIEKLKADWEQIFVDVLDTYKALVGKPLLTAAAIRKIVKVSDLGDDLIEAQVDLGRLVAKGDLTPAEATLRFRKLADERPINSSKISSDPRTWQLRPSDSESGLSFNAMVLSPLGHATALKPETQAMLYNAVWKMIHDPKKTKDVETFWQAMRQLYLSLDQVPLNVKSAVVRTGDLRGLTMFANSLGVAAMEARTYKTFTKTVAGRIMPDEAAAANKIWDGHSWDHLSDEEIANGVSAMTRLGAPMSQKLAPIQGSSSVQDLGMQFTVAMRDDMGRNIFTPRVLIEKLEATAPFDMTKSTDLVTTQVRRGWSDNPYQNVMKLWRTSVVTGLFVPKPQYFYNNFFGDISQIHLTLGLKQSLKTNLTFVGSIPSWFKSTNTVRSKMAKALGLDRNSVLPGIQEALWIPDQAAIFAGKKIWVRTKTGQLVSSDTLKETAIRFGVMESYANQDLLKYVTQISKREKWVDKIGRPLGGWQSDISDFATYVQQRQRFALFTDLVTQGYKPEVAARKTLDALFDWKYGIARWEAALFVPFIPFYRFWRLGVKQGIRENIKLLTRPSKEALQDIFFGRTALNRTRAQQVSFQAVPDIVEPQIFQEMPLHALPENERELTGVELLAAKRRAFHKMRAARSAKLGAGWVGSARAFTHFGYATPEERNYWHLTKGGDRGDYEYSFKATGPNTAVEVLNLITMMSSGLSLLGSKVGMDTVMPASEGVVRSPTASREIKGGLINLMWPHQKEFLQPWLVPEFSGGKSIMVGGDKRPNYTEFQLLSALDKFSGGNLDFFSKRGETPADSKVHGWVRPLLRNTPGELEILRTLDWIFKDPNTRAQFYKTLDQPTLANNIRSALMIGNTVLTGPRYGSNPTKIRERATRAIANNFAQMGAEADVKSEDRTPNISKIISNEALVIGAYEDYVAELSTQLETLAAGKKLSEVQIQRHTNALRQPTAPAIKALRDEYIEIIKQKKAENK